MLLSCDIKYNANGLLTSVRRYEVDADDVATSIANSIYEYNANNAVTSITHNNSSGTEIVKHSYTYDSTNNIVEYLNSLDGSTSYDYDFLGQLISADYANAGISDESYSYDSNGNRLTANGDNYTTSTNNELTSDGAWSYTYDDEGNRISKQNSTNRELYTWDYRNRLTKVTQQEWDSTTETWTTTQTIEYTYNYNNVWIRKVLDSNGDGTADSKSIFIPENYQTTVQIDNNTVSHHYLWTPNTQDKLLADVTADDVLWTLTDHLGTIRDIIQSTESGVITQAHIIYDAYGTDVSCTDSTGQPIENPILFGYTGKAFDTSTQLQNNINRWYDATIGRWLTPDPIGFEGNDTNLYRYVTNGSLNYSDKLGLYTVITSQWDSKEPIVSKPLKMDTLMSIFKGAEDLYNVVTGINADFWYNISNLRSRIKNIKNANKPSQMKKVQNGIVDVLDYEREDVGYNEIGKKNCPTDAVRTTFTLSKPVDYVVDPSYIVAPGVTVSLYFKFSLQSFYVEIIDIPKYDYTSLESLSGYGSLEIGAYLNCNRDFLDFATVQANATLDYQNTFSISMENQGATLSFGTPLLSLTYNAKVENPLFAWQISGGNQLLIPIENQKININKDIIVGLFL